MSADEAMQHDWMKEAMVHRQDGRHRDRNMRRERERQRQEQHAETANQKEAQVANNDHKHRTQTGNNYIIYDIFVMPRKNFYFL